MTFTIDVQALRQRAAASVASPASLLAKEVQPVSRLATLATDVQDEGDGAWSGREIGSFTACHARLRAAGMSDDQAEILAERLLMNRRDMDDRSVCAAECRYYLRGRCRNARRAGVGPELGQLAFIPKRCLGFEGLSEAA